MLSELVERLRKRTERIKLIRKRNETQLRPLQTFTEALESNGFVLITQNGKNKVLSKENYKTIIASTPLHKFSVHPEKFPEKISPHLQSFLFSPEQIPPKTSLHKLLTPNFIPPKKIEQLNKFISEPTLFPKNNREISSPFNDDISLLNLEKNELKKLSVNPVAFPERKTKPFNFDICQIQKFRHDPKRFPDSKTKSFNFDICRIPKFRCDPKRFPDSKTEDSLKKFDSSPKVFPKKEMLQQFLFDVKNIP
eukprot:maker-scaffold_21-snap-gene-4.41-mRNA-1 protein AED:0.11 eAED:0.11 QI:21/1/1/1/1/1/2/45/250